MQPLASRGGPHTTVTMVAQDGTFPNGTVSTHSDRPEVKKDTEDGRVSWGEETKVKQLDAVAGVL